MTKPTVFNYQEHEALKRTYEEVLKNNKLLCGAIQRFQKKLMEERVRIDAEMTKIEDELTQLEIRCKVAKQESDKGHGIHIGQACDVCVHKNVMCNVCMTADKWEEEKMKRSPEELVELMRSYTVERFFDENLTELLVEAADTIEMLNAMRMEEARIQEDIEYVEYDGDMPFPVPPETAKVRHHIQICEQLTSVYAVKNHDYGDSFARVRGMHPEAICIRVWDKLLRLESLLNGKKAKVDESIEDTLKDLANYAIMELVERKIDREEEASEK